ncbi:sigma-54-dependent transcriptional regulator [Pyxidicoccus caerfyrddinensis]|uniref:sigma-54-dependent transcriptional regulator n=1 Tax=Pyxidicoccus caerfyrddinensis TaxID=2709663 RepID=UPI0013DC6CC3|nr:response regulator [Pyxidicoccus caerfyrddinensis]
MPGAPAPRPPVGGAHEHILVVDDEEDIRDTLAMILSLEGYDVSTADRGASALAMVEARHFDLVISDLRMPGMDGVETLVRLKRLRPDLQVIIATGYASAETALRCRLEGAYDYISKPFDMDDLLSLVRGAIEAGRRDGPHPPKRQEPSSLVK